jgi:metal-dependent amidase/aminoacylase/carboxypeptidase family protein
VFASVSPLSAATIAETIASDMPGLMEVYRDLHANPELSFAEVRTVRIMADGQQSGL